MAKPAATTKKTKALSKAETLKAIAVHKKPARPARGHQPFTKQKQKFAAKPASKAVRARPVKAIKDAVK
jgi:hypothetical protein